MDSERSTKILENRLTHYFLLSVLITSHLPSLQLDLSVSAMRLFLKKPLQQLSLFFHSLLSLGQHSVEIELTKKH